MDLFLFGTQKSLKLRMYTNILTIFVAQQAPFLPFPGDGLKGNRVRIPDRPRCCELLNIRTIPWPLVSRPGRRLGWKQVRRPAGT